MTHNVHIDHELLVSYLYDECEPAGQAGIASHLGACADCAAELTALTATRELLAGWAPPDVALGFQIPRAGAGADAPAIGGEGPVRLFRPEPTGANVLEGWWKRPLPAWAQAAAAALIFAAGLAVGTASGLGGADGPAAASAPANASAQTASSVVTPPVNAPAPTTASVDQLARDIQQLRTELTTLKTSAVPERVASPASSAEVMARTRELIDDSAAGLRSELTLRTTQLARDFEIQRRQDLAQVNRSIDIVNGQAGAAAREQQQVLEGLAKVVGLSVSPGR